MFVIQHDAAQRSISDDGNPKPLPQTSTPLPLPSFSSHTHPLPAGGVPIRRCGLDVQESHLVIIGIASHNTTSPKEEALANKVRPTRPFSIGDYSTRNSYHCLWRFQPTYPVLTGICPSFWDHKVQLPILDEVQVSSKEHPSESL